LVVTLAAANLPDQGRANVTTDAVEIRLTVVLIELTLMVMSLKSASGCDLGDRPGEAS
jgi:hypothetical protein